jgi:hypothetical protein
MKASPEAGAIFGVVLCAYAIVTASVAVSRPKLLNHWAFRPKWWGFGPRASPFAAAVGSGVWFCIGLFLIDMWAHILPVSGHWILLAAAFCCFLVAGLWDLTHTSRTGA